MGKKPPFTRSEKNSPENPGGITFWGVSTGLLAFLLLGFLSLLPWDEETRGIFRQYAVLVTLYTPLAVTLYSGIELLLQRKRGPGICLILAVVVILSALAGGIRW
ncbi:MAG: hypothetical protein K6T17_00465 [Fimbriimonadales bacterium]|nr:hypothetical protein [Fimbriimonadales bacterium]